MRNKYELLNTKETRQQPEPEFIDNMQKNTKMCLTEALKSSLPKKTNRKKQQWITDDILNKMDERKAVKGRNEEHYQQLNKEISNDSKVAKVNWLNEQCREAEDLESQFRTKKCTRKLNKSQTKARQTQIWHVSKTEMVILFDKEKIAERWVEYIKELYNDNREPMPQFTTAIGQNILKEEIENVTHLMKNGKATGPDDLPAEALKVTR